VVRRIECAEGRLERLPQAIPSELMLDRLGYITTPAARPGDAIDLAHEVLR
jgi:hypothetical protein